MSSSATGVGMPICFLRAILLILTQKSSQKFGDVLGIMVLSQPILQSKLVSLRKTWNFSLRHCRICLTKIVLQQGV